MHDYIVYRLGINYVHFEVTFLVITFQTYKINQLNV